MIPAILEKVSYGIAVAVLFGQHRVPEMIFGAAILDIALGILFISAFIKARIAGRP